MTAYQLILLTPYIPLECTFTSIHSNIENRHEKMSTSSEYTLYLSEIPKFLSYIRTVGTANHPQGKKNMSTSTPQVLWSAVPTLYKRRNLFNSELFWRANL
jgi:hypothetical protein